MSIKTLSFTPLLYQYYQAMTLREPVVLQQLRAATQKLHGANMQICPEQGQFMALLIELLGAKKTLDIGTFTGYSALVVALALPENGKVVTCDISSETTQIARSFWEQAGVAHKIESRLGPALETLQNLLEKGEVETFDFAFIDADKANYLHYYEQCLMLLRQGGLMAIDNVLWGGDVADENVNDKQTTQIRLLNEKILQDERVTMSMIPIGDGLTLARKR